MCTKLKQEGPSSSTVYSINKLQFKQKTLVLQTRAEKQGNQNDRQLPNSITGFKMALGEGGGGGVSKKWRGCQ